MISEAFFSFFNDIYREIRYYFGFMLWRHNLGEKLFKGRHSRKFFFFVAPLLLNLICISLVLTLHIHCKICDSRNFFLKDRIASTKYACKQNKQTKKSISASRKTFVSEKNLDCGVTSNFTLEEAYLAYNYSVFIQNNVSNRKGRPMEGHGE